MVESNVESLVLTQQSTAEPVADAGPEMKKQEMLDKVVSRAKVKKNIAKPLLDAVLEVLGEALAEGRDLNLPPFGKVKVNRIKDLAQARVIVAKIRQAKSAPPGSKSSGRRGAKDEVAPDAE
ncbi:MAG: DNA-binding protein [Rhodobacteraceae bacterium CG17_big_fil_post_rev_8_21_14_2_50_63_15]|nr:DNA-binding protein [Roseovarius sp.]PIV78769.1 MAG: DNA-binding protein [Rhodobacteraceae bacterium CG17_big_fil_post_rev_8_21_14_2_50_63_15]